MSVEFIGMIGTQHASEIHAPHGPIIDIDYIRRFANAHEQAGFDRILVGYFSSGADGFIVASYAAFVTRKLGLMLAHRPGFVAPTLAARKLATLDHFSGGRLAVHIISGGDDEDQRKDGDFLTHDDRYERTDEYVEILRRIWTSDKPITHRGRYYTFEQSFSAVKPLQKPSIPIYFGGSSDAAIAVAGRRADVYALWGEPLAEAAKTIARVRESAARYGRSVRFSLSTRPILAPTEDEALEKLQKFSREEIIGFRVLQINPNLSKVKQLNPEEIQEKKSEFNKLSRLINLRENYEAKLIDELIKKANLKPGRHVVLDYTLNKVLAYADNIATLYSKSMSLPKSVRDGMKIHEVANTSSMTMVNY